MLVVDDDARVRGALTALIDSSGALSVVRSCGGTAEVCAADVDGATDVVLLDLLVPEPDAGLDLLRRLVDMGLPVVAMSVCGGLRSQAVAAGAVAFLEKGVAPDLILATLLRAARPRPGDSA